MPYGAHSATRALDRDTSSHGEPFLFRHLWLAARILRAPCALIAFADSSRRNTWVGDSELASRLDASLMFCALETIIVEDTLTDKRFGVSGTPRFVAATPLNSAEGDCTAMLLVLDAKPRRFTKQDVQNLEDLAALASGQIDQSGRIGNPVSLDAANRNFVEDLSEGIFVCDNQGRFRYTNRSFLELCEYTARELRGLTYVDLLVAEDRELVRNAVYGCLGGETIGRLELRLRKKRGGIANILVSGRLVFDRGMPSGVQWVALDVTRQRADEQGTRQIALAVSMVTGQEFFESLVRNLTEWIGVSAAWIAEVIPGAEFGVRSLAVWAGGKLGPAIEYEAQLASCRRLLSGIPTSGLIPADAACRLLAGFDLPYYSGTPVRSRLGEVVGILVVRNGQPIELSAHAMAAMDILAARAGAEIERRRQQFEMEKLRMLIDSSAESFGMVGLDGLVQYLNPAGLELHGIGSLEEARKRAARDLIDGGGDMRRGLLADGEWRGETVARNVADGSTRRVDVRTFFVRDSNFREPVAIAAIALDIEEKRSATEAVARGEEQLRELSDGLKRLHRLATADHPTLEDLFDDYLAAGSEMFGMQSGVICRAETDPDIFRVVYARAPRHKWLTPGLGIPATDSPCQSVTKSHFSHLVNDMGQDLKWRAHPIRLERGVESFFSAPILVAGELHSIIAFVSAEPKSADFFDSAKHEILELIAKSIGRAILESTIRQEQRLAEENLRRRERYFRSLTENASDFTIVAGADLRIAYASPSVRRGGILRGEDAVLDFDSPEPEGVVAAAWTAWTSAPGPHPPFELRLRDTKIGWVEIVAANMLADPGVRGVVLNIRDITARKQAEILERDQNTILEMIARGAGLRAIFTQAGLLIETQRPGVVAAAGLLQGGSLTQIGGPSLPESYREALECRALDPPDSCFARAVSRRSPVVASAAADPFLRAHPEIAADMNIGAAGVFPFFSNTGTVLGLLAIHAADHAALEGPDGLAQSACSLLSLAVEHHQLTEQLSFRATHDSLTGLPNRVWLAETLGHRTAPDAGEAPFAVCYLDIDHFKQVNAMIGHPGGDNVLEQTARRLRYLCQGDAAVRLGGNEFVLLLDGIRDKDQLEARMHSLLEGFHAPFPVLPHQLFLTASAGVSMFPRDGRDPSTLLRHADLALHAAKKTGGNSWRAFEPRLSEPAIERLQMEAHLRRALENGEFRPLFQPQVDAGRHVEAFEVLLSWDHPDEGRVSAGRFIPLAEETGLIVPIGAWVLRQACNQAAEWRGAGHDLRIAVNVSALQFGRPDFVDMVAAALAASGLKPSALDLELTESVLMANVDEAAAKMASLKELGITISIDDFGTGYSSLSYLRRLPVDALKIDRSFIADLFQPTTLALVETIIRLGHNTGLRVIAEGVETQEQCDRLLGIGCEHMQGHLFGQPMPVEEAVRKFRSLLRNRDQRRPARA